MIYDFSLRNLKISLNVYRKKSSIFETLFRQSPEGVTIRRSIQRAHLDPNRFRCHCRRPQTEKKIIRSVLMNIMKALKDT
jgi:hypothetical protein